MPLVSRWAGAALALAAAGCGGAEARSTAVNPAAVAAPGFWDHWGDGRAEIDSYRLTIPRYGQPREGTAVLVFVTEDFTDGLRVKSDGGHGDEYPVLKLNDTRHFQTGIYDYRVMSSTFLRLDGKRPIGLPEKTSLSVQEWCGHVYEQLIPREGSLRRTGHSYFDGEADHDVSMALPPEGVLSEALPVVARGLLGDWPPPGESVEVSLLPTLLSSRFAHRPPEWTRATLRRGSEPEGVTVPAGTFEATPFSVELDGGLQATWLVEAAPPHRIVRWSTSEGEVGELVASERAPYWKMNREGDEAALSGLGLSPAPVAGLAPETGAP